FAAFRKGEFEICHQFISEIQCSTRSRELLAQSLYYIKEKSELRKLVDPRIQVPYHLEVPYDLIEFVYLVSALFTEFSTSIVSGIGKKISCAQDLSNLSISRHLKYILLKVEEEYIFLGTPEKVSEHIYCLFRALLVYDYKKAIEIIDSKTLRNKVLIHFENSDDLLDKIFVKIRKICMQNFLMLCSHNYNSILIKNLANSFDLTSEQTLQIICGKLCENQLNGFIDEKNMRLVFFNDEDVSNNNYLDEVNILSQRMSILMTNTARLNETVNS
ncbi:MAG: Eukaryotic translation initiation factor 3 subunit C, partial [Paramarteilia canceri]